MLLVLFTLIGNIKGFAQYHWVGDQVKGESIEISCSFVTKSNHRISKLFTSYKFQDNAMSGTNIEVYQLQSSIHRIQTVTTTSEGWLIRDFYYQQGKIISVHTTIEFNEGKIPAGAPRNIYGQYYWDCSVYIKDNKLVAYNYLDKVYSLNDYDLSQDLEEAEKVYDFVVEHLDD